MQKGFYRLEHNHLSKRGSAERGPSGPLHLSAVASYMSNINKAIGVFAINLPTNREELYGELTRHSATVKRRDSHIAETFVLSFDKRMSFEHQQSAMQRFMMSITFQGQTRAEGWMHVDKDGNPHCHVLLVDRDKNGQEVGFFGRSASFRRENSPIKGNVRKWLRKQWEEDCNSVLAENGYDFRIDCRSNFDQALAKQMAEDITAIEPIPEMVNPEPEQKDDRGQYIEPAESEHPPAGLGDHPDELEAAECPPMPVDAPDSDEYGTPETPEVPMQQSAQDRAGQAADFFRALHLLRHTRNKLEYVSERVKKTSIQLQNAQKESPVFVQALHAADRKLHVAKEDFQAYRREEYRDRPHTADEKLKGFKFLGIRSPTRKAAEAALSEYNSRKSAFEIAQAAYHEAQQAVQTNTDALSAFTAERDKIANELNRLTAQMGTGKDLDEAEAALSSRMHENLKDLTPKDLLQMVQDGEIAEGDYLDCLRVIDTAEARHLIEEYEEDLSIGEVNQ